MNEIIAIIDHDNHKLYVEDIDMDVLERDYGGEEERYIKETYDIGDNYSWDFITDIVCVDGEEPIDLEIESWIK